MVYAFIIHTLFPGPCKVLFNHIYGCDELSDDDVNQSADEVDRRQQRKKQIQFVASQVHSENLFRRSVTGRTIEEDMQAINQEDQLPEFELGFLRLKKGHPFADDDKVVVWFGAGNTGFTLILHKGENRILAENVLKLLIRYFQEYLRVLNQPAEAALKADRVCLILHKLLPDGSLVFMNHRVVRALERELEIVMKS